MEGFKKKKTTDNQLFDVFFESLFGDFESKQQSALFIQNWDKEVVFLTKVAKAAGHLRNDLQTVTLS